MWGIDVSKYEMITPAGWAALKAHGCGFAMLRSGYGLTPDPWFQTHLENVKNASIPFGVYRYMYAYMDPIDQANALLRDAELSGASCLSPDFENFKDPAGRTIPPDSINGIYRRIFDTLRAAQKKIVTYTANWFVSGYAPGLRDWIAQEPIWLAAYPQISIDSWSALERALDSLKNANPVRIAGVDRWDVWQFNDKALLKDVSSNDLDLNMIKPDAFKYLFGDVTMPPEPEPLPEVPLPARSVRLLPVPYVSQVGPGADSHRGDCGAASGLMLLKAYRPNITMTVDEYYDKVNPGVDRYLSIIEVADLLDDYGIPTEWKVNRSLAELWNALRYRKPSIVLIHYGTIRDNGLSQYQDFTGPHFAVAIGMDTQSIFIHDPYRSDNQVAVAWPLDVFEESWKQVGMAPSQPNPSFGALIPVNGIGSSEAPSVYKARVIASALTVRTGPGPDYPVRAYLKYGNIVTVYEEANGWAKIANGYVSSKWIAQI